jgi:hypothetical protein
MNEKEKEKLIRSKQEKNKKLQNPLFFVANNRLSIRNLSKNATDHELKIICLKAIKAGLNKGLVTIQDMKNM